MPEPSDPRQTPAMQQYYRFKERHPGCVLLFRIGDFYEMFDQDAVDVSRAIGLTLTQRTEGVPMAGIPHHQLETYLRRLIIQGFRVAVCDQLVDAESFRAAGNKGVVPRAVVRVVSPGTVVEESLADSDSGGTLAAVAFTASGDTSPASLAVIDLSTGAFILTDCAHGQIADELARRGVRELLYAQNADGTAPPRVQPLLALPGVSGTARPGWHFRTEEALAAVREQFGVSTLEGFGLRDEDPAIPAAGAAVRYLRETQTLSEEDAAASGRWATLRHLRPPVRESPDDALVIDAVSLRALEIERTLRGSESAGPKEGERSLLALFTGAAKGMGGCRTAMGRRLVRQWLCRPLRSVEAIRARHDCVDLLVHDRVLAGSIAGLMNGVQDVARIGARVALGRVSPRELAALGASLAAAAGIAECLRDAPPFTAVRARLLSASQSLATLAADITATLAEDAPANLREGGAIRDGIDPELDEARLLRRDASTWLAQYQADLAREHNLPNLKVGFNQVFGYYIELPSAQARSAPAALIRKQTLRNAERFTTDELRAFESKVTTAEQRAMDREKALFTALCARTADRLHEIGVFADCAAEIDALLAFADKSVLRRWARPEMTEDPTLRIEGGRHPVLDELLGGDFVPNGVELGGSAAPLALITGPNMAGKSTFIRQTALIAVLAHAGCFVPAEKATVGIVDRVFTRIGADDAIHRGLSTFMVEMIETANILHHATPRSLVILDEIGRGTSTLDGLSLAWAIVEHLAGVSGAPAGPRTLFATHYHELTDLEETLKDRVANLHVTVREWPPGDPHAQIVFLHRIAPGRADQSYGVHVARLAGIPAPIVSRAREVLATLSVHQGAHTPTPPPAAPRPQPTNGQFSLFTEYLDHPAVSALRELKLESMSPMQAFDALRSLRELAAGKTNH